MRRKRLQHDADVLCQMFCGWRLVYSYDRLLQLGCLPLCRGGGRRENGLRHF